MFTDFEHKIIFVLLEGNHPVLQILRQQLKYIKRIHRKNTGAGYYVEFDIQDGPQILHKANFEIDDICIKLQGHEDDAGCILFVRNGTLAFLEIYSYSENFPEPPKILSLHYKTASRNLEKFDAFL